MAIGGPLVVVGFGTLYGINLVIGIGVVLLAAGIVWEGWLGAKKRQKPEAPQTFPPILPPEPELPPSAVPKGPPRIGGVTIRNSSDVVVAGNRLLSVDRPAFIADNVQRLQVTKNKMQSHFPKPKAPKEPKPPRPLNQTHEQERPKRRKKKR